MSRKIFILKTTLRNFDWQKYQNRLIFVVICLVFSLLLLVKQNPSDDDLITITGHLKSKPKVTRYGGDVPKTVINIHLLESSREFSIKGICAIRSIRFDLIEQLKAGDYVYLKVNRERSFPAYEEKVYSFKDDTQEYLQRSNYDDCENRFETFLIFVCTMAAIIAIASILKAATLPWRKTG